ncbi:hypothetical protein HOW07_14240 [Plantibacter sp. MCCC 1A11337]|uniref:hypothetical protein n=1 Tax=Plantibacter sp. MCCC 1A11337 TaxID=2736644 RepID=UPI00158298F3|nr:hypothetical protein [Plantibacter sp. MCCC 1A11337]NUJ89169.1 hypothetical protein [Plantibacter sp. MCCC 1A11337]
MDTTPLTERIAAAVRQALTDHERSESETAHSTSMHPETLRAKLAGELDFTIGELSLIAGTMGLRGADLLPLTTSSTPGATDV